MKQPNRSRSFSIVDVILFVLTIACIVAFLVTTLASCASITPSNIELCLPSLDGKTFACQGRDGVPEIKPIEKVSQTHVCMPLSDFGQMVKTCRQP